MIVDTMNYSEVGAYLLSFAKSNLQRVGALLKYNENKYKRAMLINGEKRVDFKPIKFESDEIEVFIFPYSLGKRDYKKYGMCYYYVLRFFFRGQFWWAKVSNSYDCVEIYQYHFFERYIERHLHTDDMVSASIVKDYFVKTNCVTATHRIDSDKYDNCCYGTTPIGMCLGSIYKCKGGDIKVWKTYINSNTIECGRKKEVLDRYSSKLIPIGVDDLGLNIYPMF